MTLQRIALMGAGSVGAISYDTDAQTYITAVETADGQSLETAVCGAINAFVVGCKADSIWTAIKASCILAGARTLSGALVPLVGTAAPTNIGPFVSTDYNRKTGLTGNGSSKALRTALLASALSNTSHHMFFNGSGFESSGSANRIIGGVYNGSSLASLLDLVIIDAVNVRRETRSGTGGNSPGDSATITSGLISSGSLAMSRTAANSLALYQNGSVAVTATNSNTPSLPAIGFGVFGRNDNGSISGCTASTINFFSVGNGLTNTQVSNLHSRVSTLISALAAAIP